MRLPTGASIFVAGLAAAVVLPLLALGLRLPLWLAATVAIAVFFGLKLLLQPSASPGVLRPEPLDDARRDTARGLIAEARTALDRLKQSTRGVRDRDMRAGLERLSVTADRVLDEITDDPGKAMGVRRLLTFYLPNAASVAEGWRALEGRRLPAPERMDQTRDTIRALDDVFNRFADELSQPQIDTLDLDLKVLNDALKSDLEKTP